MSLTEGEGGLLVALVSRPVEGGLREVALRVGLLRPRAVTVEARQEGRTVASVGYVPTEDGEYGGVFSLEEPTSVHYSCTYGPGGERVCVAEFDYDLHGGGTGAQLARGADVVQADRIRFVLHGTAAVGSPVMIRL